MGKPVKKFKHITGQVEELEPAELATLLSTNKKNRPPTQSHVDHMASQMPREWRLTGEPVIIGSDGSLLDGQHRCLGALQAECSLVTFVVRGVDPKAFRAMGTGKTRSLSDVFGIKGEVSRFTLAAAVSWLWRYQKGAMLMSAKAAGLTNERGDKFLARHPRLRESVAEACGHWGRDIGLFAGHAALHYLYSEIDAEKTTRFFERLSPEGHIAGKKSPPNVLVSWLLKNVIRAARPASKTEVMAVSVKAMRAYFLGRSISRLTYITKGPKAEDFPELMPGLGSRGVRKRKVEE